MALVLCGLVGLGAAWWLLAPDDSSGSAADANSGPASTRAAEPEPDDLEDRPDGDQAAPGSGVGSGIPDVVYVGGGPDVDSLPWAPATIAIVDPTDFGAVGDGVANDGDAIEMAMEALPSEGGIVYFPEGGSFRTSWVMWIDHDHIKLWSPNGQAEIFTEGDEERSQAFLCRDLDGCGFFGLRFRSDATMRLDTLEDSQIVADGANLVEIVGVEIEGSASAAIFFFGESEEAFVEGNYLHHNWADAVHFTNGSRRAWVWDNTMFNGADGLGDDGVACVTYEDERLCGEMEWWHNTHLGDGWGRGFSVIGGEEIRIHDNFARDTAGAGIIVASESAYDTESSRAITIANNVLFRTSRKIPHPSILVSAETSEISDVSILGNLVVDPTSGESIRVEGDTSDVDDDGTETEFSNLPDPLPSRDGVVGLRDTSVLRTRDVSFAPEQTRRGLYRIHVRRSPDGQGFQQGFEYVVAGPSEAIDRWTADGARAAVYRSGDGDDERAVVFSAQPVEVPEQLRAVGFAELRAADIDGSGSELWSTLHPDR